MRNRLEVMVMMLVMAMALLGRGLDLGGLTPSTTGLALVVSELVSDSWWGRW